METVVIKLKAENSSGEQLLFLDKQSSTEVSLTLVGEYREENIQIDFDTLSEKQSKKLMKLFKALK